LPLQIEALQNKRTSTDAIGCRASTCEFLSTSVMAHVVSTAIGYVQRKP